MTAMRWRVLVARRLLRGTPYFVASQAVETAVCERIADLWTYAFRSGGLRTPKRIHAWRRLLHFADDLRSAASRLREES